LASSDESRLLLRKKTFECREISQKRKAFERLAAGGRITIKSRQIASQNSFSIPSSRSFTYTRVLSGARNSGGWSDSAPSLHLFPAGRLPRELGKVEHRRRPARSETRIQSSAIVDLDQQMPYTNSQRYHMEEAPALA
jgi:hypothetical protein